MPHSNILVTNPPRVFYSSQGNQYVSIGNSIYLIREQQSKEIYKGYNSPLIGPSIAGDTIYVNLHTSKNAMIQAQRVNDQRVLWEYIQEDPLPHPTSPLIIDDQVYIRGTRGVSALDRKTGILLWQCSADFLHLPQISIEGKTLYAFSQAGGPILSAIERLTGKLLWHVPLSSSTYSTLTVPVVTPHMIYLSTLSGCIALHNDNGSFLWQYDNASFFPHIEAKNKYVYLSYSARKQRDEKGLRRNSQSFEQEITIDAIHQRTGTVIWKQRLDGDELLDLATPSASDPTILYVSTKKKANSSSIYALDADTGLLLWNFEEKETLLSPPFVENTTVYVGANDGYVYALRAVTGDFLWKAFISTAYKTMIFASVTVTRIE